MGKIETFKKPRKSGQKYLTEHIPFQNKEISNHKIVADALLECIRTGDPESFREILIAHLMTANKTAMAKKMGIGRRTLYDLLDPNKEFNPGLSTVSAIIQALAA